jgi:hypothetical protein
MRALAIQKRSKFVKNEHAQYTLERYKVRIIYQKIWYFRHYIHQLTSNQLVLLLKKMMWRLFTWVLHQKLFFTRSICNPFHVTWWFYAYSMYVAVNMTVAGHSKDIHFYKHLMGMGKKVENQINSVLRKQFKLSITARTVLMLWKPALCSWLCLWLSSLCFSKYIRFPLIW